MLIESKTNGRQIKRISFCFIKIVKDCQRSKVCALKSPCSLQWCNSLRPNLTMAIETKCWCENNAVNENIDHKAWEHHLEMMAEQCTMYESGKFWTALERMQ